MKRFLLCLLFSSFIFAAKAQLTHLTEVPFPAVALNDFNYVETYTIYGEGPYAMMSMTDYANNDYQAYMYNQNTGEVSDFPFIVRNQFRIGEEYFYAGLFVNAPYAYTYFKLTDSGEPQMVDNFPAIPSVEYSGKSYGMKQNDLWEFSDNPLSMKKIATFDLPTSYPPAQFSIAGDTVYVASYHGFDTFSLSDSSYAKPYANFISDHHLEVIPYSELNGKFLYYDFSKEDIIKIYELGAGMSPRAIPSSSPLPYKMMYWYLNQSYNGNTPKGCFASSGHVTWLNIQDYRSDFYRISDVLLKVDRSATNPHIDLIRDFERAKTFGYGGEDAKMIAFGDGNKLSALGLFGPEGYEPYGMDGDSLIALHDYIPGSRGSVDAVMYSEPSARRPSDNPVSWQGKSWLPASLPHYGREIVYSDGTVSGTGVLGDLARGGDGCRIVRFAPAGDKMFILVQRDDLTFGLFELGTTIPNFDIAVDDNASWMDEFGAFPESGMYYSNQGLASRDRLISDGDGFLYYLSVPSAIGALMGDTPGVYGFNGEEDQNWENPSFRLKKIDAQTGDVVFSKTFHNPYIQVASRGYQLVKDDEDIVILGWGLPGYRDEGQEIAPSDGSLPQLVFTRFDTDGNFKSLTPLPRNTAEVNVLFLSVLENGNFLTILKQPESYYRDYRVQEISPDGVLIVDKTIKLKQGESVYFRKDETNTGVYITQYNIADKDDILDARFFRYTSTNGLEELGKIKYSGTMKDPDIFIKPNGERWFTGALNGRLILDDNVTNYDLTTGTYKYYKVFSLRTSPVVNAYSDLTILSDSATHYFGSFVHDDEIYLQFLAPDPSQPELDFKQHNSYFTFDSPSNLEFHTVQLDKNAHEFARKSQLWKVGSLNRSIRLTTIVTENSEWYQMVVAGKDNIVHVDTLLPPPVFQTSMGYRVEMMPRIWDFKPSSLNITDANPGEDGNFLNIFPNPNNGTFNILPNNGNRIPYSGFKIFDIQGRIVYNGDLPDTFNYLQLHLPSTLRAGVYQLRFEGEGVSEMHRMVLVK